MWGKRARKSKPLPKCRRCIPGHKCRVVSSEGDHTYTYCAICRNTMSTLELMRPRLALVELPQSVDAVVTGSRE